MVYLGYGHNVPLPDGVYIVKVDDSIEVAIYEYDQYLRFESVVAVMPSSDNLRKNILVSLLQRSARMVRYRREGIFAGRDGSTVYLQRNVVYLNFSVAGMAAENRDYVKSLYAWRALAGVSVNNENTTDVMNSH